MYTKLQIKILPFLLTAVTVFAQTPTVHLRGIIRNQRNFAVPNLRVRLRNVNLIDTTDSNGRFTLISGGTSIITEGGIERTNIAVRNSRLYFDIPADRERVSLDLYSLSGARVMNVFNSTLSRGEHSISFENLEGLAASTYLAVFKIGNNVSTFRMVSQGSSRHLNIQNIQTGFSTSSSQSREAQTVRDTIIIMRRNSVEFRIPLTNYSGDYTVTLDLVPHEIVEIAMAERDRWPSEVGRSINYYPYDLYRYLRKTGTGVNDVEWWCSNFLSWVYRAAGYPLSNTNRRGAPDWYITNNTGLRSWFRTNTQFINKENRNWASFVPAPGDFIRYNTSGGGHTGIVRYQQRQSDGTFTLYTIEGNVGNRVRARTIRDWKRVSNSVDGIGRISGYRESGFTRRNITAAPWEYEQEE